MYFTKPMKLDYKHSGNNEFCFSFFRVFIVKSLLLRSGSTYCYSFNLTITLLTVCSYVMSRYVTLRYVMLPYILSYC